MNTLILIKVIQPVIIVKNHYYRKRKEYDKNDINLIEIDFLNINIDCKCYNTTTNNNAKYH